MKNSLQMEINKISSIFTKCFINGRDELILDPVRNFYFGLEDVETVLDFKCKFIAWFSRACCKGLSKRMHSINRSKFNRYFNTNFTQDYMMEIYGCLGNDVNRKLCVKFVESGLNMNVLRNKK